MTTADTGAGTMPDYWRTPAEDEPIGAFAIETAASYLRDKAARCLALAAALDPLNIGGQDPHPRFGRDQNDIDEEIT